MALRVVLGRCGRAGLGRGHRVEALWVALGGGGRAGLGRGHRVQALRVVLGGWAGLGHGYLSCWVSWAGGGWRGSEVHGEPDGPPGGAVTSAAPVAGQLADDK